MSRTFLPFSKTLPWTTILRASYTLCAKHARKITTSILRSTSENIKLPTGASPFRLSSSARLAALSAALSFNAHLFKSAPASTVSEAGGRTSGKLSGRYHRLKIFSLM